MTTENQTVDITFTAGTPAAWDTSRLDSDRYLDITYSLNSQSTSGWKFSSLSIAFNGKTFTYPSDPRPYFFTDSSGNPLATILTVNANANATSYEILICNQNKTGQPQPLCLALTVSNENGGTSTSPDPQVILDPR